LWPIRPVETVRLGRAIETLGLLWDSNPAPRAPRPLPVRGWLPHRIWPQDFVNTVSA
jgi:hypothetical protein